ncbi:putative reverse transcriptase domain-containing protein [Tanacetum coccineum]|uniref:Reverse transcriptase domain-containing protein n=1 Tax=Tanacetum coccineum TaxID=301880 RepID=A0ABQ5B401_9ASTR
MTMKEVDGETIMKMETKVIAKDGTFSKFLGKFPGYMPLKQEQEEPEKNGGNNRCSYKTFMACNPKEYDGKGGAIALTRWIEKMESVFDNSGCDENQRVKFVASSFMNKALTWWNTQVQARGRKATIVSYGTLTKGNKKRKGVEETSKPGGSWKDNKKEKVGTGFVATAPSRNEFVGPYPKCAKCYSYHPENGPCRLCYNCQKLDLFAKDCRALFTQVAPVKAVRMALGQAGNPLALEGNRNARNNGNPAREMAFNINAADALQDPNVVTEVNGYGYCKKVEVDRIIHDCKLELGNSLFIIDLIHLGHGSFDVIVRIDWLSNNKAVIVCHEKVVKVDEPKLSDIPIIRDLVDVFRKDLWGLPPQRQVGFRIDLVLGATLVAKSPYRLAPSEMQ